MSDGDQDIEQNIRMRAYLLWESEGRQEGRADHYWHRASELIEFGKPLGLSAGAVYGEPELTLSSRKSLPHGRRDCRLVKKEEGPPLRRLGTPTTIGKFRICLLRVSSARFRLPPELVLLGTHFSNLRP